MQVKYVGPKANRTMHFPLPVVSHSAVEGTIVFRRDEWTECPDAWADSLFVYCPESFHKESESSHTAEAPAVKKSLPSRRPHKGDAT